jgi:hypothetical protein
MRRQGQLLIREVKFDALTPRATYLSSTHDQHSGKPFFRSLERTRGQRLYEAIQIVRYDRIHSFT